MHVSIPEHPVHGHICCKQHCFVWCYAQKRQSQGLGRRSPLIPNPCTAGATHRSCGERVAHSGAHLRLQLLRPQRGRAMLDRQVLRKLVACPHVALCREGATVQLCMRSGMLAGT